MSLLLQVLVGVLVVILCVVVCGCMVVVRQYLRHLDQQQRLGVEVRHDPGELNATTSIEIFDGNDNGKHGARSGVRNRQQPNYPQHPRYDQVPHTQMAHMTAPQLGTILTTTTTITTTTTASRTPSPAPSREHSHEMYPSYDTYAGHAPHAVAHHHDPAGARGVPRVHAPQDRFVSGHERTAHRAGRVVRNQRNTKLDVLVGTETSQKGGSVETYDFTKYQTDDTNTWMKGQKGKGEGETIAVSLGEFLKTSPAFKSAGDVIIKALGNTDVTYDEAWKKTNEPNASEELKIFVGYLEYEKTKAKWTRLLKENDEEGIDEFLADRFKKMSMWRQYTLTIDFYRIYNGINEKLSARGITKTLKDLPIAADTYIGWDYENKKLIYVVPNKNAYMENIRGKKEYQCFTTCNFYFDAFYQLRQRLKQRGVLKKDNDYYALQIYRRSN